MTTERTPKPEGNAQSFSEKAEAFIRQLVSKVAKRQEAREVALAKVGGEEGVIWPSRRYDVAEVMDRELSDQRESA